jgi:hypothetical protein
MDYVTPRNVTNGSTAGDGVFYAFASIATSCNNRTARKYDFCWVIPRLYNEEQEDKPGMTVLARPAAI